MALEHKRVTVVGSVPTQGNELLFLIDISFLRSGIKAKKLSSASQLAVSQKFGAKWRTQCLNARFPLSTLIYAGYSVKLKKGEINISSINMCR